jgi:hypothetical protein
MDWGWPRDEGPPRYAATISAARLATFAGLVTTKLSVKFQMALCTAAASSFRLLSGMPIVFGCGCALFRMKSTSGG